MQSSKYKVNINDLTLIMLATFAGIDQYTVCLIARIGPV